MNLSPPSSQKAGERPISFALDDAAGGGALQSVDLVIRPEELTRADPSRVNVQQTLGGAWADGWGAGIANINLSGHTGWRRTEADSGDGLERFLRLKDQVFDQWHIRRDAAATAGKDPSDVQLIFSDALDGFSSVVVPLSFTLRRSRTRPLLAQYQISLTVLGDVAQYNQQSKSSAGSGLFGGGVLQSLGLDSLTASVNQITGYINNARNFVDRTLLAPVQGFMLQTARLYGAVRGAISAASGIAGSLINVARSVTQAGVNVFRTFAAVASLPSQVKSWFKGVASAYTNIFCVLGNALRQRIYYPDYSDVYGASNCSSTSGGRPISSIAGENPFYKVVPTQSPLPVSLSSDAQSSIRTLARVDTVLAPMSVSSVASSLRTIVSGMAVA